MNTGKLQRQVDLENTRLQVSIALTLSSVCDIERLTKTSNGAGGFTETWTSPGGLTNVPCALNVPSKDSETVNLDQPSSRKRYTLHLPKDTDIRTQDRVVISGEMYYVECIEPFVSVEAARLVTVVWTE